MAVLAFAVQGYVIYFFRGKLAGPWGDIRAFLLTASYGLLLVFIWLNRHLPGLALIAAGLSLNLAVMLANGGFMPVTPEALRRGGQLHLVDTLEEWARVRNTKNVVLYRENTRLWFLSDVFVIPPPVPIASIFSVGDVFIAAGVFLFFHRALRDSHSQ